MTSDELREHIARLTAADRRALRTRIAAPMASTATPPRTHAPAARIVRQRARSTRVPGRGFARVSDERERRYERHDAPQPPSAASG